MDNSVEQPEGAIDDEKEVPKPNDQEEFIVDNVEAEHTESIFSLWVSSTSIPTQQRLFGKKLWRTTFTLNKYTMLSLEMPRT